MVAFTHLIKTYANQHIRLNLGISANRSTFMHDKLITVSAFPEISWIFAPMHTVTGFINYSIAGISYLNKKHFGRSHTGKPEPIGQLNFQDYLGFGAKIGKYSLSVRFLHYSDAGIFDPHHGYDIPFTLNFGYSFN